MIIENYRILPDDVDGPQLCVMRIQPVQYKKP